MSRIKLPTEKKQPILDPKEFMVLLFGRPKIGKTTFFSQWEDPLFITTEPGTKGMEIYENECEKWADIRDVVKLLEADDERFETVVIDTVDQAYDMCLVHTCKRLGISYPGVTPSGDRDYGKSWNAVKMEFMRMVHRILRTGRGVCMTSHAKQEEITTSSGLSFDRIVPSLTGQGRAVIEGLVDIILYADYFRDLDTNETVRAIVCHGDELVWAGARKTAGKFPQFLPMVEEGAYEVFEQGFRGEHPGLDPTRLRLTPQSSEVVGEFLSRVKRKAKREKRKKKARRMPRRKEG